VKKKIEKERETTFFGTDRPGWENINMFPLEGTFPIIIMTWNVIDCFSQLRLKIVRDKYGDLFNNIGLIYQSLNICVVFFTFLLRLKKYMHGIKQIF